MNKTMIDIDNIAELEHAFAEDFGTPIFPVLANHYLKNKDMNRSRKVCELGLKHNPHNSDGQFILAKLNLYENKLRNGEQLLKKIVNENPVHINGLRILIEVMRVLNRSSNSIKKYINRILYILPNDEDALGLLKTLNASADISTKTEKSKQSIPATDNKKVIISRKKEISNEFIDAPPKDAIFDVGMGMATFTMVGVLTSQKNYKQALAVLNRLEEKGADQKRVLSEREALEKLLATE